MLVTPALYVFIYLYLSTTVGSFLHTEANKQWISQFNQDVINTVDMKILHPPSLHILQDLVVYKGTIKTSVPI